MPKLLRELFHFQMQYKLFGQGGALENVFACICGMATHYKQ